MKKFQSTIVVALLLFVIFFSFPRIEVYAEQNTLVVPDDYGSIQEAIDAAVAGDVVYVLRGEYHENLVINKSLSLIGENVDTTIIDGFPTSEMHRIPIRINADNVSVSCFKILYGYAGIQLASVKNCVISGNRIAGGVHGVLLSCSENNNITENYFESIGSSGSIRLYGSSNNFVYKNYITAFVEGIQIYSSHNNTVAENTIENCTVVTTVNVGIRFQNSHQNTITRNTITDAGTGIVIYTSNNNTIYHNNFINNTEQLSANEWYAQTFGYTYSNNTINENYWTDYHGEDVDGNGFGDSAYVIDEYNQDNNPLMTQVDITKIPEFPTWSILPILSAITLVVIKANQKLKQNANKGVF
ncbi:MAG: right-handed parallel beta-helix repeat-containing protein [Candidatus Bathyarchaeota archaeon]|nr:right-handed parallel beta-helix repeat-containing protein [Candidatus Bathyarchaeum tardum]WGM88689.1 MAG: right-handed parallel beta-helix repeat-containing protein [Candidatus Bathyarchaeum tardum]